MSTNNDAFHYRDGSTPKVGDIIDDPRGGYVYVVKRVDGVVVYCEELHAFYPSSFNLLTREEEK